MNNKYTLAKPLVAKILYCNQKHPKFLFTQSYPLAFLPFEIYVKKIILRLSQPSMLPIQWES